MNRHNDFYAEPEKKIPVLAKVDVLVVGAGPAGFAAALNASRLGAKVMLIEQTGQIGGIATVGLMSHWTGDTEGPIYEEILKRCAAPFPEEDLDSVWNGLKNQSLRRNIFKVNFTELDICGNCHVIRSNLSKYYIDELKERTSIFFKRYSPF